MHAHGLVAALALVALAVAPGVRGAAHTQCTDGTPITDPKLGSCDKIMTGAWTPSQCTSIYLPAANATTALVDTAVKASIDGLGKMLTDKTTCKAAYGTLGCDKVKADPDCSWACAYGGMMAQTTFGCNSKTVCTTNKGVPLPKCSSMSEMLTAICDKTAEEIKTIVADGQKASKCADDGMAFSPPVQTTPAPAAPADTKFFVTLTVTLPYTKADFDQAKQDKYKTAMAATAGTSAANVEVVKITEKRRRAGSVEVETKIRASDAAGADKLTSTLGTGDALKTKLNAELVKQSLKESSGVTAPAKAAGTAGAGLLSATWALVLTAPVVAYGLLV